MSESVTLTISEHVAEVVINRPEKKNALNWGIFDGLSELGREIAADRSVRAVILTGAGGNFSSGIDLSSLMGTLASNAQFREEALVLEDGEIANRFQKAAYVWRGMPVPVIAAVEGVCFGGGLQIALAADIRIAAPEARMSTMEVKWGLIPDMGIMTILPRLMRIDQAKELTWTGRIVAANEALALGLITQIAQNPLAEARQLAGEIAAKSPDAIRGAKRLLEDGWAANSKDALAMEAQIQCDILGFENQTEAVRANLEKRQPVFRDMGR